MVNSLRSVIDVGECCSSPSILDALFAVLDTYIWKFISQSMVTPKSFSSGIASTEVFIILCSKLVKPTWRTLHFTSLNLPVSGTRLLTDLGNPGVVDSSNGNLYTGRAWCYLQISLQYM